jgi:hypothetical protein
MSNWNRFAGGSALAVLAAALVAPTAIYAQETTGEISGRVLAAGQPVAGARVVLTHTPSGTRSNASTSADGSFDASGLRIGGPYSISITAPGYQAQTITEAFVTLGTPLALTTTLEAEAARAVDVVVVRASTLRTRDLQTGQSSLYRAELIERLPSFNRDPKDAARLNPFVNIDPANQDAISIAGQNSRFNSLTVDGVKQNDDFGLNNNGYPTQRSPVSMDAVQAIAVNVAPFAVRYNDFTGGNINLVTRSGTNAFQGGIFGDFSSDALASGRTRVNQRGNDNAGVVQNYSPILALRPNITAFDLTETAWGAHLGGPIIKDRLFFFLSYEVFKREIGALSGPEDSSFANPIAGISSAQVTQVATALSSVYKFNFDTANSILQDNIFPENDKKILAKVDWNIIDGHRASVTYQNTDSDRIVEGLRSGGSQLSLASNYYAVIDPIETLKVQVNSDWTDTFKTTLTYATKENNRGQLPLAGTDPLSVTGAGDDKLFFGQVSVQTQASGPTRTIVAGPDRSRHANALTNKTVTIGAEADWKLGDHKIYGAFERESIDVFNLFAQDAEGTYLFQANSALSLSTGIAALQAGRAQSLNYRGAALDANGDGAINKIDIGIGFETITDAIMLQDTWNVTEDLSLLFGVRYERLATDDAPLLNNGFRDRTGFSNNATLDGRDVILPRFGFNYRLNSTMKLTGGFGLFSGGAPNVWVSNNYSNDGVRTAAISCVRAGSSTCPIGVALSVLDNVNPFDVPNVLDELVRNPAFRQFTGINLLDPSFEMQSTWRYSLNYDINIPAGDDTWRVSINALHSQAENALTWKDVRASQNPTSWATSRTITSCSVAPDGRPIYAGSALCAGGFTSRFGGTLTAATGESDLMLTNTDEGRATSIAAVVQRTFTSGPFKGVDMSASYTFSQAKEVNSGTSSVAFSNYANLALSDSQNPGLTTSSYEIPHNFKLNLNFQEKFFGDNKTKISGVFEARSGQPFSYTQIALDPTNGGTFNGGVAAFGDVGGNSRHLLYVPNEVDPKVFYNMSAAERAGFEAFLTSSGLSGERGSISQRNAYRNATVFRADMRLAQELPAFFPNGAKAEVFVDFRNIGNMINDKWGLVEQIAFPGTAAIVQSRIMRNGQTLVTPNGTFTCAQGNGCYVYQNFSVPLAETNTPDSPRRSQWQIKVGAKYTF